MSCKEIQFGEIVGAEFFRSSGLFRNRSGRSKGVKIRKRIRAKRVVDTAVIAVIALVATCSRPALNVPWWPLVKKAGIRFVVVGVVRRRNNGGVHVVSAIICTGTGGRGRVVTVGQICQLLGVFSPSRNNILVFLFLRPPDSQKSEISPPRIFR